MYPETTNEADLSDVFSGACLPTTIVMPTETEIIIMCSDDDILTELTAKRDSSSFVFLRFLHCH